MAKPRDKDSNPVLRGIHGRRDTRQHKRGHPRNAGQFQDCGTASANASRCSAVVWGLRPQSVRL